MTDKESTIRRIEEEREFISSSEFRANLAIASGKVPRARLEISLSTFTIIKDALNLARLRSIGKREAGFDYDDYELALIELMRNNKMEFAYTQVKAKTKLENLNRKEK